MTVNDSMDLDHVDSTSPEEVDAALMRLWAHRGPYFTGTEGMHAACEVLEPIFDDWEDGA